MKKISYVLFILVAIVHPIVLSQMKQDAEAYASAQQWVRDNPNITVIQPMFERIGDERATQRTSEQDLLQLAGFEKSFSNKTEMQITHGQWGNLWVYYPASLKGPIYCWPNSVPEPNVPDCVSTTRLCYEQTFNTIKMFYTTEPVRPRSGLILVAICLMCLITGGMLQVAARMS
jgi:hypothetical protein